jgi:hypothetical protein
MPARRPKYPPIDAERIASRWQVDTSDMNLYAYASLLRVDANALLSLGAGWADAYTAWSFPMRNAAGKAIGIRLRANDGRKWSVTGSRSGIFFDNQASDWRGQTALVCEGPTDTAAGITMGFPAIGKPCCNAGNDYVIELLNRLKPSRVLLVSDVDSMLSDGIGFKEALKLKSKIGKRCNVWAPQAKDLREFLKFGGTKQLIESEISKMLWS